MSLLPKALESLIEELGSLPGVGPRTAERYAYHILKADPHKAKRLSTSLSNLHQGVSFCKKTFALVESGTEISPLYSDDSRDKQVVLVVAEPLDVIAIEKTNQFRGTYHVLGGLISPIDGVGPEQLRLVELIDRISKDKVAELILAINGSVEGETTALYIQKRLEDKSIKVTRLARGLPVGVDLEYADQITLSQALEGRQAL